MTRQHEDDHEANARRRPRLSRRRGGTPADRLHAGRSAALRPPERRERVRQALGRGWRAPARSLATRVLSLKSQGSMRAVLASLGEHLVGCESGGERNLALTLAIDPRVASFREQPEAVIYEVDGESRQHVPDFLVTRRDGRTEAIDYRPDCRAASVRRLVETLNEQRVGGVDTRRHVGDAKLPRSIVRRADLIGMVRRDGPFADDPAVARMRLVVDRPMSVAEAVAASGDGGLGFRALVHLIDAGALRMRDGLAIAYEKMVEPVPADLGGAA